MKYLIIAPGQAQQAGKIQNPASLQLCFIIKKCHHQHFSLHFLKGYLSARVFPQQALDIQIEVLRQMIPSDPEGQFKVCCPFTGVEQCILRIYRVEYSTEDFFGVKDKHSPSPCPYMSVLQLSHFLPLSCMKSRDYQVEISILKMV